MRAEQLKTALFIHKEAWERGHVEWQESIDLSDTLPPTRSHWSFPNGSVSWGARIQTYKSMGAILVETTTLRVCLSGSYFASKTLVFLSLSFYYYCMHCLILKNIPKFCLRNVTHGAMELTFTGCVYVDARDT